MSATSEETNTDSSSDSAAAADASTASSKVEDVVSQSALRWWPAALLLLTMLVLRLLPGMIESPGMAVMMLGFMGPVLGGLLLLLWWCFASRASVKEKLLGLGGFVAGAAVALSLIHMTLQGMWSVMFVFPTAAAAFALGLVLLASRPGLRLPVALTMCLLTFGYWDLVQSEGVTGTFGADLLWRWEPTAEEQYLQELAATAAADTQILDSGPVTLASAEWPAFRGPDRAGVVSGVVIDGDWQRSPPREIWKQKIGPGWSSFSVAGKRLFTQEQRGESEAVVCLHADTGAMLWDYTYSSRFWEAIAGAGPRATPTIADEGLFALGADGILVCLDATDGSEIWKRDLKQDADRLPPTWGFSASPLVTDSMVIVHAGGAADKGLFAFDAGNGEIVWSVPSGDHSYSSAQLATFDSVRGILMLTNDGLQFVKVSDGRTIWEHSWPHNNYRTLQPLVMGDSVLITTSIQEGTRRLTVSHTSEDAWDIEENWTSRHMKSDYNDYVAHDGHLYGFDGSIFACIDLATGSRQWKRGRYGNGQVLLLSDAGQMLIVSEKGEIVLVNANPDELEEVAKLQAIEGKTWNHPVVIGDRLYIRNAEEAACYQLPLVLRQEPPQVANLN